MLKVVAVLAVLGVGGYFVWSKYLRPPEQRTCAKIQSLCGEKADKLDKCEQDVAELGKLGGGAESMKKLDTCVGNSTTCGEAIGCMAGTGFSAAGRAMGDFLKGMGKALEH